MVSAGTPILTLAEQRLLLDSVRNRMYNTGLEDLRLLEADMINADVHHFVATYDFAVDGGAIGVHAIGSDIPVGALILGGFVENETTATSATDAGTGALSVVGAGDIVAPIAISNGANPWDAGRKAIVPKFNTPESTSIKVAVANQIDFTIAVEAFTAGKFHVHLFYVMSAF